MKKKYGKPTSVRIPNETLKQLDELYPLVDLPTQIRLAANDLTAMKKGKFFNETSIYASYQLGDGNWQAEAIFDTVIEAIDCMKFHSQGRPWRISNASLGIAPAKEPHTMIV
jgi:hypothetical protein